MLRGQRGKVPREEERHAGLLLRAHVATTLNERAWGPGASVRGLGSGDEVPQLGALGRKLGVRRREGEGLQSVRPPEGGGTAARGAAARRRAPGSAWSSSSFPPASLPLFSFYL